MKQTTHSVAPERRGQRRCNRKLILALLFAGRAFAIQFPSDAGVIDVTAAPYNAPHYAMVNGSCAQGASSAGDATSAIQSAMWAAATLTGYPAQIVYLPNGCYKVSNTIWWQSCNDGETPASTCANAFLQMIGQSQAGTGLYVPPSSSNFQSTANCAPGKYQGWLAGSTGCRAVLYTCSIGGAGGPVYCDSNNAYMDNIHDLTVEIGTNNPGAIGISLIENNSGSLRNVTIKSNDTTPIYGLDLTRQLNGPGLVENVTITGFKYGIISGSGGQIAPFNGITLNHIFMTGQANNCMTVFNQQMWLRDFNCNGPNVGIQTSTDFNRVMLATGSFTGGSSGVSAITSAGTGGVFFLRNITCSGFKSCLNNNGTIVAGNTISEYASSVKSQFPSMGVSLNLPVTETPTYTDTNFSADWANVKSYGAAGNCSNDDTTAIQAAMNSGKPVVYFPFACYRADAASGPITIPATVRLIEGLGSCISANGNSCNGASGSGPQRTTFTSSVNGNVIFDNFFVDKSTTGCWTYTGAGSFTLTDIFNLHCFQGNSSGKIFTDDSAITGLSVTGGGNFFCVQCNTESGGAHIEVNGETAWILGHKIEGDSTGGNCTLADGVTPTTCGILWVHNNAVVEVLGGWYYSTGAVGALLQNSQVSIANLSIPASYSSCYSETRNGGTANLACNGNFDGSDSTALYSGNTVAQGGGGPPIENIVATGGAPQAATVNTAFATSLQATATDGNPMSGATVTFTAPASGASGTFSGASEVTVITNASGVATAPIFTANGIAGNYTVTASMAGVPTPASFNLTNSAVVIIGSPLAAGTYEITSGSQIIDGGFGYWGATPAVQFYSINNNAYQHWTWDGSRFLNNGWAAYMADAGNGTVTENSSGDTWTVTASGSGFVVKNNRTGNYLENNGNILAMGSTPTVWAFAGSSTGIPVGSLTGSATTSSAAVNLTTEGTTDWIHWGDTAVNRKSGVTAQLSSYTVVGTVPLLKYSGDPRPVSWTDGTSTASSTNNTAGVYVYIVGNGFSVTAPADTTTRKLILHLGGWNSGAKLTAHLSDGSAVDYTNTAAGSTGQYDNNYTLIYNAASSGQTLKVTWTMASGTNGNVTLNAAALQ